MKRIFTLLSSCLAVFGSAQNLVLNSGFELNTWGGTSYETLFPGDATTLPGWLVNGGGAEVPGSIDLVGTNYGPHSGDFAVDLAGTPGPGGVQQDIAVSSGSYLVSFWARSSGGYPNDAVLASFGGSNHVIGISGDWQQYSFLENAAGLTTLNLATRPNNTTNGNVFVDDISVTATPEPATIAVLGIGAMAMIRRRRNK